MGVDKAIKDHYDKQRVTIMEYIRKRGYVSYSSLKNLRDGKMPSYAPNINFEIGTEVHLQWMEKKIGNVSLFDDEQTKSIKRMVQALNKDKVASSLLKGADVEVEFNQLLKGVRCFGYIDILPPVKLIGDLKTTSLTTSKAFIEQQDFLQPALYMAITKREDFYYIGVSKANYQVFTERVSKYPERLKKSQNELNQLLKYVKEHL